MTLGPRSSATAPPRLARRLATGFLAAVTLTLAVACASPSPATIRHEHLRKERALARKQASAARERLAVAADGGGHVLRLGVTRQVADAAGLVGAQLGFFQQALGASVRLELVPFRSAAAEGRALEAGQLDAAYVDPVTAVGVWLASGSRPITVAAGAAARGAGTDRASAAVLVITTALRMSRPAQAIAILKGHIQAELLLGTDPVQARAAIAAELAVLGAKRLSGKALGRALARLQYTNDPLASSVLLQARRAEAVHLITRPPSSLARLYDLGPLNQLLRAAGEVAVPG
ncbi:MAG TPA: hypothetical protein VFI65_34450 [Streptosporangiaceae bacterium]|nr:hypothetical protein [Streptosporangiaceae bacterium]